MSDLLTVQIDGELLDPKTAAVPVTDLGFIRGLGVFEVVRAYEGVCFRLGPHLERLGRSAQMLGIKLPSTEDLATWCHRAAADQTECVVRIMVTAGDDPFDGTPRTVVTSEILHSRGTETTLVPVFAPWHADGADWELLRAKTLSYGNNYGAIRQAKLAGFDDAILIGRSGRILEGPTFTVGWVVEEHGEVIYETPAMTLGILDSITRQLALDAATDSGLQFREVEAGLERLDVAIEFFAFSTLRDTLAVTAVGERQFPAGPHTAALRRAMADRIDKDLAHSMKQR